MAPVNVIVPLAGVKVTPVSSQFPAIECVLFPGAQVPLVIVRVPDTVQSPIDVNVAPLLIVTLSNGLPSTSPAAAVLKIKVDPVAFNVPLKVICLSTVIKLVPVVRVPAPVISTAVIVLLFVSRVPGPVMSIMLKI